MRTASRAGGTAAAEGPAAAPAWPAAVAAGGGGAPAGLAGLAQAVDRLTRSDAEARKANERLKQSIARSLRSGSMRPAALSTADNHGATTGLATPRGGGPPLHCTRCVLGTAVVTSPAALVGADCSPGHSAGGNGGRALGWVIRILVAQRHAGRLLHETHHGVAAETAQAAG